MGDDQDAELEAIRARKLKELMDGGSPYARGSVITVTDSDLDDVLKDNELAVIDCWAEWCEPCKTIAPVFEKLAGKYAGDVAFLKLNVDQNPRTSARFAVMSIPTLLTFRDGSPVDRIVGALPEPQIDQVISKLVSDQ